MKNNTKIGKEASIKIKPQNIKTNTNPQKAEWRNK
jgi:hypothetical protein